MMAFMPTDLPCPVAPATSRCGVFAKSKMKVSFDIVFPIATGNSYVLFWNFIELNTDFMLTTCGSALGTSMPITPLPGIGAMILMP